MLRLERVSKYYSAGGVVSTGFSKVDVEFHIGEFVAITGESGSGKSTLLNVISGLDSFEEGEMYVNGQPTSGYTKEDLEEYRKKYIGSIFQTFNLINSYTVYQNVELVLLMSGYDRKEIPARVREIIAKVGLSEYEKTKASKLSGGQKQRVAIARALAKETPVIVADEPTGNLDSRSAAEIVRLLHELSEDKLIIIVTHNYEQVEPYVTRKITMHDGRIAEDKRISHPEASEDRQAPARAGTQTGGAVSKAVSSLEERPVKTARAGALSFGSMTRLGIRNTFNIPAKFLLLLVVFLFLNAGVIAQYSSFRNMQDMDTGGYSNYFENLSRNRILVTREDRKELTEADYEKLSAISNVQRIVENDLMLDMMVNITDDSENYYICARVENQSAFEQELAEGRMAETAREAVLLIPHDEYADNVIDMVLDQKVLTTSQYNGEKLTDGKIRITGYGYLTEEQEEAMEESSSYSEGYLCMTDAGMKDMRQNLLEQYCSQSIRFGDYVLDGSTGMGYMSLAPSDKVPQGEIYIPEDVGALVDGWPTGRELSVTNKSQYFEDTFDFRVGAVYNKENLEYYLGRSDFEEISGTLFISQKDFDAMFDKGNFQSSVITADEKLTHETAAAIEKAGYSTFCVNDGMISYSGGFDVILDTIYGIMLAAVIIVLFFISYFIIKLILKSRNIYFSTIRMLGATRKNCSSLLKVELFAVFNIAYLLCLAAVILVKKEIIQVQYLQHLVSFLSATDLVLLYVVLCALSILLAARYARGLFRKTAMNAYKEEV